MEHEYNMGQTKTLFINLYIITLLAILSFIAYMYFNFNTFIQEEIIMGTLAIGVIFGFNIVIFSYIFGDWFFHKFVEKDTATINKNKQSISQNKESVKETK